VSEAHNLDEIEVESSEYSLDDCCQPELNLPKTLMCFSQMMMMMIN